LERRSYVGCKYGQGDKACCIKKGEGGKPEKRRKEAEPLSFAYAGHARGQEPGNEEKKGGQAWIDTRKRYSKTHNRNRPITEVETDEEKRHAGRGTEQKQE